MNIDKEKNISLSVREPEKEEKPWLALAFMVLCGAAGFFVGKYLILPLMGRYDAVTMLCMLPLYLLTAWFIQVLVHEFGHLVGGLVSGYEFISFRIGHLILLQTDKGARLRIMPQPGSMGECIMSPPENKKDFACGLYMSGGYIFNLLCMIAAVPVCFLSTNSFFTLFIYSFIIIGAFYALKNGIPSRAGGVPNDGCLLKILSGSRSSREAFHRQRKIQRLLADGKRLRDMPEELFTLSENDDRRDPFIASLGVFAEKRCLDDLRLDFSCDHAEELLNGSWRLYGELKPLVKLDFVFSGILIDGNGADISSLCDKDCKRLLSERSKTPAVLRTRYAAAAVIDCDYKKRSRIRRQFEGLEKTYPYAGEYASEKELMELVDERARHVQTKEKKNNHILLK